MDCMAIQAIVPMKVAISADNTAQRQCIPQSLHDLFVLEQGSIPFGRKTSHFARVLLALKESTIRVTMGAYKKIKISPRYIFCCHCCFDHNVFASPSLSVITGDHHIEDNEQHQYDGKSASQIPVAGLGKFLFDDITNEQDFAAA